MKKIIFIAAALCFAFAANAQEIIISSSTDTLNNSGDHNVGWLRSHLMDNWMLTLQGGGNIYMGFEDSQGALLDRVAPRAEISLGRWIFPMVGLRAGLGIGSERGFVSKSSYLANRGAMTADYGHCWGTSADRLVSGPDTIAGSLGGYFWPVDGNDDIFIQKWNYLNVGADILVNLSYLKEFDKIKTDSRWNNIIFLGFNFRAGISEAHPEKFSNSIGYSEELKSFKNTNVAAEGHLGYICKYALTDNLSLQGDARLSIIEGNFDRERIDGVESMSPDLELSAMVGLTYDFNFRSDKKRREFYVERGILPYNTSRLPKFINYIQQEEIKIIRVVDTIKYIYHDTIDDVIALREYDSLRVYYDTSHVHIGNIADDEPLDSILMKRMLPYEMVFFERDKWDIRPQEELKIAKMAHVMKAFPNRKFILYGSADSKTGTVKRNIFLSHNRADIVYNKLVTEYGIPESQLSREYLGGILDYDPYILNRTTVIIMDHPAVKKAFNEMKSKRQAGGGVAEY